MVQLRRMKAHTPSVTHLVAPPLTRSVSEGTDIRISSITAVVMVIKQKPRRVLYSEALLVLEKTTVTWPMFKLLCQHCPEGEK